MLKKCFLAFSSLLFVCNIMAQEDSASVSTATAVDAALKQDSLSKFDSFNKKMEKLFTWCPVPLFSYSTEAGQTFGLAKFNLFDRYKDDTVTQPSKLSEVATFSTKGRINASVSGELVFKDNKYILLSYINYKKQPEYIFGIGNDVKKEDMEEVQFERVKFYSTFLFRVAKNFYAGVPLDVGWYFNIKPDTANGKHSFLLPPPPEPPVTGYDGGFYLGSGLAAAFDSRDNRYNTYKGAYILAILVAHPEWIGSTHNYTRFELDARKFFNPWYKHVIALQATTLSNTGNTPFYELSKMGGDKQMRGYYEGAYRDKVLVDAQVEYRMPIWNIFGITAWAGTGRVAPNYGALSWDGWKLSYGGGIRIKVDSKHNTNLRIDFGFGPGGISGTYINFAEAF
jgi:hypothetical protein